MRRRAAALVVLAVTASVSAANAQDGASADRSPPSIVVEGQAGRDVPPDMAVLTIGVTTTRGSARDAAAVNSQTGQSLVGTLKAEGIGEADIASTQATLAPVYDAPKSGTAPRVTAFRADNVVTVKVRKVDQAGALAGRLLDAGANDLRGIEFTVSDPEPVLDELRAEATRNARHRAELYAEAIGLKLGRVLLIQPEQAAIATPRAFKLAAAPAPAGDGAIAVPLSTGSATLEARVSVTWTLEQAP